jgi:RND superfamily putative drug exporter
MFARWGFLVDRHPWRVMLLSLLVFLMTASIIAKVVLLGGGELRNPRSLNLESGDAAQQVERDLPHANTTTVGSSFLLLLSDPSRRVTDPGFRQAVEDSLRDLRNDSRVTDVTTPYSVPAAAASTYTSKDGHTALAVVDLKDDFTKAQHYYQHLRDKVRSNSLKVLATGNVAINATFNTVLAADLERAEVFSIPLTIIFLLLVFGAVIAAGLPLGIGMLSIIGGVGGVFALAHVTDVSQYAINIVTLIGLGVSIDYSLFIVNRFREELVKGNGGNGRGAAMSRTMATAGRAITFSGLTVAIGLGGMLFYTGSFLPSMGMAGGIVVALAVFYSLTLLPAILVLLGPRINTWSLPFGVGKGEGRFWHGLAMAVMRRPLLVLLPTVALIVAAGIPFAHIRLANGDVDQLPAQSEVRRGAELLTSGFPGRAETTVEVVVSFPGDPLTPERVGAVYDLGRRLGAIQGVSRVDSIVTLDPGLSRADYQRQYSAPPSTLPAPVRDAVQRSVGHHIVTLGAVTNQPPESDPAREIVRTIRSDRTVGDGRLSVTGQTAFDLDIVDYIIGRTPVAVAFIVVVTCVVLFLLLGSVLLPVKAVVMNFLSLSASFGALVFIFQDGHLKQLLNFTPTSIDPSVPVILFCIVFGLSMDYEVLLMSRMKEEFDRTGDNRLAVAAGLERSGRLVTGAAAIMVAVFLGFGLAEVLLIKAIGLGMAIAVAIDATLVRALVVPAAMRLLGNANWWAPAPLRRVYAKLGFSETATVKVTA